MNLEPVWSTGVAIGGGFFAGILIGYALKKIVKLVAIVVGLFFAALAYLQYQQIVNINWNKLQGISQNGLAALSNTIINNTSAIGSAHGVTTLSNLIPLSSSASDGFVLGLARG